MKQEFLVGGLVLAGSIAYYILFKSKRVNIKSKPLPPIVIDPAVLGPRAAPSTHLLPPPEESPWRNSVLLAKEQAIDAAKLAAPYELPEFGIDSQRNTDSVDLDDFMNLPLVGEGVTWQTRDAYHEADAVENASTPKIIRFRYLRFRVLETRGEGAETAIGGLKFMNGMKAIDDPAATLWNPYSGETAPWKPNAPWSDADQRQIVVKFSHAVAVTRYQIKTATEADSAAKDPVRWIIEGSQNGTFWLALDNRVERKMVVPEGRGVWMNWKIQSVV